MNTPHALILPFPAQGHIIPLMELSYCLIERGFHVTFINTQFNHERIFTEMLLPDQAKLIDGIHFMTIPDGLEQEEDRHNFGRLMTSLTTITPSFLEKLMKNNVAVKFTCFIADINMAWALSIAKNMGLRTAGFWPAAAGILAAMFQIPKLIQDGVIDEEDGAPKKKDVIQVIPRLSPMDTINLPWNCLSDAYTRKIIFNYFITNKQASSDAEMIICNSFEELEKPMFSEIPNILPVGPLLSTFQSREDPNLCQLWLEDKECMAWLNKQSTCSVIYVAFGSIAIFNNRQFEELALGLELTGQPFLWVVRPDLTNKSINAYPSGFEERVANRGRMIGWSPQQKVLKHPAIACFISHCGWNSTIEGVKNGVPFLCWPYFADQFFNQSYITKVWKVGLSLSLDENGLISKEEVGSKVEELLKDRDILAKSQALKKLAQKSAMEGGSSFDNLNKFASFLSDI
ncbi:hypothetical protein M5K25_011291 [Dendrobium thyrsiflorum]|uniref:UDP-glycosyltransferase n=1 Tax=Dendrobium thyrsiflorum TaxID=117978 RepID=A0ABD0V3G6_DENTH